MKANITLSLDADLLRETRMIAAEEGRSVSAVVEDCLNCLVRERKVFDAPVGELWPACEEGSICAGLVLGPDTTFTSGCKSDDEFLPPP